MLEMMIALSISALVLVIMFRYSFFLEKSLHASSTTLEMIEKYNVVFAWIVKDVELSGYLGCLQGQKRSNTMDPSGYLSDEWLKTTNSSLESQYMSLQQYRILENNGHDILISGDNNLKENNVVVIENCWQAEIAEIKTITKINHNQQARVSFYSPIQVSGVDEMYIAKLVQHKYFIKQNKSLYVSDINSRDEEVLGNMNRLELRRSGTQVNISLVNLDNNKTLSLVARMYNAQ